MSVLRIGFAPLEEGPLTLAAGETIDVVFSMAVLPGARVVVSHLAGTGRSIVLGCGAPRYYVDDVRARGQIDEWVDGSDVLAIEVYSRSTGSGSSSSSSSSSSSFSTSRISPVCASISTSVRPDTPGTSISNE